MLPPDVRPLEARTVAPGFDARRHATSKTYRYVLDRTPHGDPFVARYALHHPHAMDLDAVREALRLLPGRRDWSGFAGSACEVEDRVRNLTRASCETPVPSVLALEFEADGFLNHMVRNLVGTLLEIARGRFPPGRILEILAATLSPRAPAVSC